MKSLLRKLSWRIYHAVHTNGLAADVVYWGAFYVKIFGGGSITNGSPNITLRRKNFCASPLGTVGYLVTGVTNICNAKCTFCAYPRSSPTRPSRRASCRSRFSRRPWTNGRPSAAGAWTSRPSSGIRSWTPACLEKVDYAVNRARIKNVYLTTNAILINKNDTYKKLIDLGIAAVFISTQGANREVYEKIYGVKHYDEAMSGIRNLMEYNRSKGEPARIVVRFRNHEKPSQIIHSQDFNKNIQPYLSERVRINFTVDFDNWGGTIQPEDMSGSMRLRKLPPRLNVPCKNLFNFAVRHDGRVRLCGCRLTHQRQRRSGGRQHPGKTLTEISKSDKAWNIIKGFYSGKRPETCLECTFYKPIDRRWLERRAAVNPALPAEKPVAPANRSLRETLLSKMLASPASTH